ncbi:hypothetical protein B0O99DRAFT_637941 [Bisporella sp. PMI_857]|nr:hypothetical protein B0O99DRAFT_637941 [Bisporella sp. PMI_857]
MSKLLPRNSDASSRDASGETGAGGASSAIEERSKTLAFTFVNTSGRPTKNAKTKTVIRRHVKLYLDRVKRGDPPPKDQKAIQALTESIARTLASGVCANTGGYWQGIGNRWLGDGYTASLSRFGSSRTDPFIKYPVDLTPETGALLDHIFDQSYDFMNPYREAFFPVGLLDPASFYQILSNLTWLVQAIAPERNFKPEKFENDGIALNYSRAIKMVKTRLSSPEAASSEGTIAAIISMACYAKITSDNTAWMFHINVLRNILRPPTDAELAAGKRNKSPYMSLTPLLAISIGWIDTGVCTTLDLIPFFPFCSHILPLYPSYPVSVTISPVLSHLTASLSATHPSLLPLLTLLLDTAKLSAFLTHNLIANPKVWHDLTFASQYIQPLNHRLIRLRAPLTSPANILHEVLRLAMMLHFAPIRKAFGSVPVTMDVHIDKLLPLLKNGGMDILLSEVEGWKLQFWVLSMALMWVKDVPRKEFLEGKLRNLAWELEIQSYEDAEQVLGNIMCIELHRILFRGVWEDMKVFG